MQLLKITKEGGKKLNIFKLVGSIMVDSDDADKSLKKIDKSTEGVGNKLAKGIGTAAKFGVGLAVAAGAGAAALFGVAVKSAEATDRIDKLSQKIGMSRKGFQEMDFIASQSGMSIEVLQSGFKKLSDTMVDASEGNKLASKAFTDLGVSAEDSTGKLKSQEQMFNETIVALQKMPEGAKKSSIANDLLGKSASELAPLINGAAGSVEEMRKKANDLGLVLSDTAIDSGVKFTDSMDQIKRSLGAMGTKIGAEVMPIVQRMLEWVTLHMPQIQAISSKVFNVIGAVVKEVGGFINTVLLPAFMGFWNWVSPYIPKVKSIIVNAFTAIKGIIKTAYDYIKPSFDNLVQVIKSSLMPTIMGLWGTVQRAMPGIKAIFQIVFPIIVAVIKTVIDAIASYIKVVAAIYKAIKPSLDTVATLFSTVFGGIKKVIDGVQWALNLFNRTKMKNKSSTVNTKYTSSGSSSQYGGVNRGYASGTDYATPGAHWVGEEGPEIVNFKGGETVTNATDSAKIANNKGLTLTIGTFVNNRKEDIEELAEELEFYRKKNAMARG